MVSAYEIKSPKRIGLPAFRAVGVKQKIVKIPEHEVFVTLVRPAAIAAGGVELEKDLAVHQQSEQFQPGKACLPSQPADLLRRGQHGDRARDLWIANPEQRAGARRFQHQVVAAPPQIGESRQHDRIGVRMLWRRGQ